MKLSPAKAYLLGAVGAVALVASLVANVETIFDFAIKAFSYISPRPPLDVLYIEADGSLAPPIEDLLDNYGFPIRLREYEDGYRYSLAVHIEARFGDPTFNSAEFLQGVASLSLVEPAQEEVSVAVQDRHPLEAWVEWLDAGWGRVYKGGTADQTSSVKWTVYIKHKKKPDRHTKYTFQSGHKYWTLTLSAPNWEMYSLADENEKRWWGAQGSAIVTLDDPDWVVLRSARILQLADGDGSILETVIHNQSSVAIPLSTLILRAMRRKTILCNDSSGIIPGPRQKVTVNWSRLVGQTALGTADAVRTTMRGEEVRTKAFYDPEDCSKPVTFEAQVPLEVTVPPGELRWISLKITEKKESDDAKRGFDLANWATLLVSIAPRDRISPPSVLVDR